MIISTLSSYAETGERTKLEGIPIGKFMLILEKRIEAIQTPKELKMEIIQSLKDVIYMDKTQFIKTQFSFANALGTGWVGFFYAIKKNDDEIDLEYSCRIVEVVLKPMKIIVRQSKSNLFSSWTEDKVIERPAVMTPEIQELLE